MTPRRLLSPNEARCEILSRLSKPGLGKATLTRNGKGEQKAQPGKSHCTRPGALGFELRGGSSRCALGPSVVRLTKTLDSNKPAAESAEKRQSQIYFYSVNFSLSALNG